MRNGRAQRACGHALTHWAAATRQSRSYQRYELRCRAATTQQSRSYQRYELQCRAAELGVPAAKR